LPCADRRQLISKRADLLYAFVVSFWRRVSIGLVLGAACAPFAVNDPVLDASVASPDAAADVVTLPEPDAGARPLGNGIACHTDGGETCPPGNACCEVWGGGVDHCIERSTSDSCPGEDAGGTSVIDCDDPNDCAAGQICCGVLTLDTFAKFHAQCRADCTGAGRLRLCRAAADCPTGTCTALSQALAGPFSACE
jgi:hypothetical protein